MDVKPMTPEERDALAREHVRLARETLIDVRVAVHEGRKNNEQIYKLTGAVNQLTGRVDVLEHSSADRSSGHGTFDSSDPLLPKPPRLPMESYTDEDVAAASPKESIRIVTHETVKQTPMLKRIEAKTDEQTEMITSGFKAVSDGYKKSGLKDVILGSIGVVLASFLLNILTQCNARMNMSMPKQGASPPAAVSAAK